MIKVLLTGASGLLGSVTCRHLSEQHFDVRATDICYHPDLPVKVIAADLLDREKCYELVDGVDAIVHLAGHPRDGVRDPQTLMKENVAMTINIMQAARECNVARICYASSIQAMAHEYPTRARPIAPCTLPYLPADGDVPANPGTLYGVSKQACEDILRFYASRYGMSCTVLRFPALKSMDGEQPARRRQGVWACPDQCFSYLTFKDAARLIAAILHSALDGFRIYFPVAQAVRSEKTIAELVKLYYPGVPLRKSVEELPCLVDISSITAETGWVPLENNLVAY